MMTKSIPLSKERFALVDDEDYDFLMQWKWCFNIGYAVRSTSRPNRKKIYMHREILKTSADVDHISGDGLDNRRSNLRTCDAKQNGANRKLNKNNKVGFKGVSIKSANSWSACIRLDGKTVHIGTFSTAMSAAVAYDSEAKRFFGPYARLNFPEGN
jgi:hypothetical protein